MKNMALRWLIFTEGVVKEQGISKRVCSCSWLEWSEPQYELCGVAQGLCALTVDKQSLLEGTLNVSPLSSRYVK